LWLDIKISNQINNKIIKTKAELAATELTATEEERPV
jgi:hypothetical protein